jgi:BirA family transcriptional regulator, biotin operon repressor / biotin---[acetyl-CoA-carboxylase] ligase
VSFGVPHHHYRRTDSTNRRARELVDAGAPAGMVVTADEQTVGRGRRGRAWSAPPGKALLYSAVLRPLEARHALLPLAVPVAVCEAIESVAPVRCEIKWPNDVWIEERKTAGILIESRPPEWAVIGIGVNVAIEPREFPAELRWPATSVDHGASVAATRPALDRALAVWMDAAPERALDAFRSRDALRGRAVSWEDGPPGIERGTGTADGIDDRGDLIVDADGGGRVALGAGEVQLRVG